MSSAAVAGIVPMPRLSDSMEEGTVISWLKKVGDPVAIGDELVEIETDKANMAYEADVSGVLLEVFAGEGDVVAVGDPIARIGDPATAAAPAGPPPGAADEEPPADPDPPRADEVRPPSLGNGDPRLKASPLARRVAEEQGVELSSLAGSGPGGRIVVADVRSARPARPTANQEATAPAAVSPSETAKGEVEVLELSKLQQVVARRMSESKATAPHFYLEAEVDMSAAVTARRALKAMAGEGQVVPTFNDMVVKACALALREFPIANGAYRDGRFEFHSRINVGVAVASDDALVVPTVFDADSKGLTQIAAETRMLAEKVRNGTVTPPELAGGTFTVSNLGMFGVSSFQAVINSPQAGILAIGELAPRPVVNASGEVVARETMRVTLSCDHRILYGADGARFLGRVRRFLEQPVGLAL